MRDVFKMVWVTVAAVAAIVAIGLISAPAKGETLDLPTATAVLVVSANGRGICSGTVIAPERVLTARHCVDAGADARVRTADGAWHVVIARKVSETVDAAVITATGVACPCAPIAETIAITSGPGSTTLLPVRSVGFPDGKWSDALGYIIGITTVDGDYSEQVDILHTAYIAPGSSGGGLWQEQGAGNWVLIGINVHGFGDPWMQVILYYGATPVTDIRDILE